MGTFCEEPTSFWGETFARIITDGPPDLQADLALFLSGKAPEFESFFMEVEPN